MTLRRQLVRIAGILLGVAASLAAAAGSASAGKTPEARPAEPARPLIERVTSELVLIEAYVTDRNGRSVRGLGLDNFSLLVDGKKAPIASLEYRELGPAATAGGAVPAGAGEEPRSTAEAAPAGGLPRRFVLFFEDEISAPQGLTMARRAAERFLRASLLPDDQAALITHRKGLHVLVDFTTDREALLRALAQSLDDPGRLSDFSRELLERERQIRETLRLGESADPATRSAGLLLRSYASEDSRRITDALTALRSVINALAPWPGYKAIVFLGDGIPDNPGAYYLDRLADLPALARNDLVTAIAQVTSLDVEFKQLVDAASAARVTLDTVETSGLDANNTMDTPGSSSRRAAAPRSNALRTLALNTGGVSTTYNDPLRGLVETEATSRAYYVIGYAPVGPPDGRSHTAVIRLRRAGAAEVRWRRQFVRLRPEEARERSIEAAHLLPELYPNLSLDLSLVPGPADRSGRVVDLILHLPARQILFLPEGGVPTAHLELSVVAFDESHRETLRLARNLTVPLRADDGRQADLGLDLFDRARLPAAGESITVVVNDLAAGTIGALHRDLPGRGGGTQQILGLSIYSLAEKSLWIELDRAAGPDGAAGGPSPGAATGGAAPGSFVTTAVGGPAVASPGYRLGPTVKTTFSAGQPLACGFRLERPPGASVAPLKIAIRKADREVRSVDVAGGGQGEAVKVSLPVDGLPAGDYEVVVQEVVSGRPVDLGSAPLKLRVAAQTPA